MITQLTGYLIAKNGLAITIDVNGVGYTVLMSMTALTYLPELGEKVTVHTYLSIREDAHILYGFVQLPEKYLFSELIKVTGIGGKLALVILSHISVEQFIAVINLNNVVELTKIPGIGQKTAQRLILEMRSIINKKFINNLMPDLDPASSTNNAITIISPIIKDAEDALIALGYRSKEAVTAINKVLQKNPDRYKLPTSEELIKAALKNLSKICC